MKVVVGCPIYARQWILPAWMEAVKRELSAHELTLVFVYGRNDLGCIKQLWEECEGYPLWLVEGATVSRDVSHKWESEDFFRMASLRNQLLRKVRDLQPDLFLSLDSDMILCEGAFSSMAAVSNQGYSGVGAVASMCRFRWCESWMYYNEDSKDFHRHNEPGDFDGIKEVDAIMGAKLMTPDAYNLDYVYDKQGEDLGWSRQMRNEGMRMAVTAAGAVRHVMHEDDL